MWCVCGWSECCVVVCFFVCCLSFRVSTNLNYKKCKFTFLARNQDGYPNDPDDNNVNNEKANNTYRNHAMSFHDDKNPSSNHFSNQSPDLNVLYSIIPQCLKNTGPFRLYNEIRNQFFSDRVSYELTCSQLYLSVLTTRGKCVKFFLKNRI